MEPYIRKFSCFMAAPEVQVCLCSFKDELVFSVTSAFIQQPVIRNFFRDIVDMGIDLVLESNDFDAPSNEQAAEKPEPPAVNAVKAVEQPEPAVEQTDAEPVTEPTETGKKRTKRARKDNDTDETGHTV
jgi:hypothetical protein